MEDAILKEVRSAKDRIAAKYHGDVKTYMADIRKGHAKSKLRKSPKSTPAAKRKSA